MPARGSSKRPPALAHCWTEDGLPPPPKAKRKPRKPKRKKRFHQAFRVLIALGLIPTKSRQCDPLGLRLKRMQVVEAGTELGKLLELKEPPAAPAITNGETAPDIPPPQEFEASEPKVKEEEEIPEVKEEDCPIEQPSVPSPPPVEETSQPRPTSPKDEEMPSVEPSAPPEEASRKRSIEKDQEGEGSSSSDSDSSRKKNRTEQETEPSINIPNGNRMPPAEDERERMISEFVSEVSLSSESLSEAAERLAKEVENLTELAAAKEMEWNTILRVKKLKEEMLERVLRRKRMNHFDSQFNPETPVPELGINNKGIPGSLQLPLRHPRLAEMGKLPQRPILPKPLCMNFPGRDGRNRPVVDVKSIIDDYRSRHPESPARRGRRVRTTPEQRFPSINPSLISMANMALGTGASVRTVSDHNNFIAMGGMEHVQPGEMGGSKESSGRGPPGGTNGAKPYPEVTLHPVSPPSLLHQVLTKSQGPPRPASNFSPTLARLLTAPERPSPPPHFRPPSRVSIADILSSTKLKNEKVSDFNCSNFPSILTALLKDKDGESQSETEDSNGSSEKLKEAQETSEEVSTQPGDFLKGGEGPAKRPRPPTPPVGVLKKQFLLKVGPTPKTASQGLKTFFAFRPTMASNVKLITPSSATVTEGSNLSRLPGTTITVSRSATSPKAVSPSRSTSPPALTNFSQRESTKQYKAPPAKKSRNEITITPVSGNPGTKKDDVVCLDDDDGEAGDRLVIDEGGDDVPTCQGCRHKSAQFVCAGCGNQWYCSRECQVSAWEEHSDMCSG